MKTAGLRANLFRESWVSVGKKGIPDSVQKTHFMRQQNKSYTYQDNVNLLRWSSRCCDCVAYVGPVC
jgi:hypothetical protein